MKFNKSERVYHQENFNPPANYYNPSDQINKDILYGSLAGPVLMNKRINNFGYQKRFQQKLSCTPGPGQYLLKQHKKVLIQTLNKDKKPKQFLKETLRLQDQFPSIPCHYYDKNMNEQDKEYIRELQLNQDVLKATQKIKRRQPMYTFSRSPRTKQKIVLQKKVDYIRDGLLQKICEDKIQTIKINQFKKKQKTSVLWQEAIKKSSQKRNQIINQITPDFVPSLQIIQIMSKQRTRYIPGPGAYQSLQESQINLIKNKGVVFNTQKRFLKQKINKLGPGFYDVKQIKSTKGISFDKTKRQIFNLKDQTDLYHRFYINPNPRADPKLQQVLAFKPEQNNMRSSSCVSLRKASQISQTPFGSCSRRFSIDTRSSQNEQIQRRQVNQYEQSKKQNFKKMLKKKLKKLQNDYALQKQDSGLLGISTMASTIDF